MPTCPVEMGGSSDSYNRVAAFARNGVMIARESCRRWAAGHMCLWRSIPAKPSSSTGRRTGIYDNMRTAIDKIGRGKERDVNVRFQAMASHYLFEPEFCNPASGWGEEDQKTVQWTVFPMNARSPSGGPGG